MKIGIDIGGSHIAIALVNEEGKILEKNETDIEDIENAEVFIEKYIMKNIHNMVPQKKIESIGIASPGTPKDGKIFSMYNLGIKELDIAKMIQKYYNIPVNIRNDGKCSALAEKKYGSLKEYNDCIFLCLGTGIGAGVFLDGKLLETKRAPGFEIGHMVINKNGIRCNCGKTGCFETYCSMKRFKDNVRAILNLNSDISAVELLDIIEKNKDNLRLKDLIDEYINNLIIGFSNLIDIFEPEAISLGGSFVYFRDVFYDKLVSEFNKRKYYFNKDIKTEIKLAMLGNDAGIIGATINH